MFYMISYLSYIFHDIFIEVNGEKLKNGVVQN